MASLIAEEEEKGLNKEFNPAPPVSDATAPSPPAAVADDDDDNNCNPPGGGAQQRHRDRKINLHPLELLLHGYLFLLWLNNAAVLVVWIWKDWI